jgi:hypothetical protein
MTSEQLTLSAKVEVRAFLKLTVRDFSVFWIGYCKNNVSINDVFAKRNFAILQVVFGQEDIDR